MKKNHIIVQIVLYSVLALVLISLLSGLLMGHGRFRGFSGIRWFGEDVIEFTPGDQQQIKSQDLSEQEVAQLTGIKLDMPVQDITILPSEDNGIHIKQYGKDAKTGFTTYTENGVITIQASYTKKWSFNKFFGGAHDWQQIQVYLPDSYTGDLEIQLSTGETEIQRPLKLNRLVLNCSAGTFTSEDFIECKTFQADLSAGELDLKHLQAKQYTVSATTGTIDVEKLFGSGSMDITMGEIDVGIYEITGRAAFNGTMGNIDLSVQPGLSFSFSGSKTAGSLDTNFPCTVSGSSVTAQIGDQTENRLETSITAGNVSVEIDD